jgi:hypothetical protein
MRIGFRILALAAVAALTACGEERAGTITEYVPDPTMVRVRVINATNTNIDFAAPTGDFIGHNTNVSHSNSRCIEMAPGGAVRIRDFPTKTAYAPPPTTTFEAGKSYSLLVYNPTSAANTVAYLTWQNEGQNTPPADSAGLAIVNVNSANTTSSGQLDVYINPNVDPAPALALANRKVIALPVGGMTPYFTVGGGTSTHLRLTRTGSTTSGNTLLNSTHTPLAGQNTVWVFGIPSLTAATTQRSFTTGGC